MTPALSALLVLPRQPRLFLLRDPLAKAVPECLLVTVDLLRQAAADLIKCQHQRLELPGRPQCLDDLFTYRRPERLLELLDLPPELGEFNGVLDREIDAVAGLFQLQFVSAGAFGG